MQLQCNCIHTDLVSTNHAELFLRVSPRSVAEVGPAVVALGDAIGADVPESLMAPQWDRWLDVELARKVGARGVLVRTGYGAAEEHRPTAGVTADAIVNNLVEAASWILERVARG